MSWLAARRELAQKSAECRDTQQAGNFLLTLPMFMPSTTTICVPSSIATATGNRTTRSTRPTMRSFWDSTKRAALELTKSTFSSGDPTHLTRRMDAGKKPWLKTFTSLEDEFLQPGGRGTHGRQSSPKFLRDRIGGDGENDLRDSQFTAKLARLESPESGRTLPAVGIVR